MENINEIKEKLIEQISKEIPADEAKDFISEIKNMSPDEFINFLKEQNLLKKEDKNECIFCSMINEQIPVIKINENTEGISILEINPISKGHTLIIPKKHLSSKEKLPIEIEKLIEDTFKKLNTSFHPKKIELINDDSFGHKIINLLPIYNDENINSPRQKRTQSELEALKKEIDSSNENKNEIPLEKIVEKKIEINEKNTWLPKRFP